jgi:hypothetical protein
MKNQFTQGWHPGTSNYDHHRGKYKDCIGSSFLKTFADRSPKHARFAVDNQVDPTPAMIIGSAFHSIALGFSDEVVVVDKPKTPKQDGEKYQIHTETHGNIRNMVDALKKHRIAKNLMQFEDREITGLWNWKEFGVDIWCKLRPDLISHDAKIIVDLKSTTDASYKAFNRDIFKFGYHISAFWYKYGVKAITGSDYKFVIAAVEKAPPHGVNCFDISGMAIKKAEEKVADIIAEVGECVKSNKWPGYEVRLHKPDPPNWIF